MFRGGNLHTVFQPIAQIFPLNHQYMMALAWCTLEVFHWIVCFVHNRALRNIYHVWYFMMNVQSDKSMIWPNFSGKFLPIKKQPNIFLIIL